MFGPTMLTLVSAARRALPAALALPLLAGCSLVYKLPINQGNVIDRKELKKVEVGMTPDQVEFVLGTAMVKSDLQSEQRWDYVSYYLSPRGKKTTRNVSLFFEGDTLARIEGNALPDDTQPEGEISDGEERAIEEAKEQAKDAEDASEEAINPDDYVIPEDNDGLVTPG